MSLHSDIGTQVMLGVDVFVLHKDGGLRYGKHIFLYATRVRGSER